MINKRHFQINKKTFSLPDDFVSSPYKYKYLKYKISRVVIVNPINSLQYLPDDLIIHSNFIYYYPYNDYFMCIANQSYDTGKKWLLNSELHEKYNIWFTSISTGEIVDIEDGKFVIEVLLEQTDKIEIK